MSNVVPEAWKSRLQAYLHQRSSGTRDRLSAVDFPADQGVFVRFADGSYAHFRFAFAIEDETAGEVAVSTEHRGSHVFPLGDAEIEVFRTVGPTRDE